MRLILSSPSRIAFAAIAVVVVIAAAIIAATGSDAADLGPVIVGSVALATLLGLVLDSGK